MNRVQNFAIGMSDFTRIVQGQYTLIDKTMFIQEIMEDGAGVILITRPRRFGKTLALSMLEAFLSKEGADVFGGLNISKETQFCAAHQNKYPVISLSFKDAKDTEFESVMSKIREEFSKIYKQHHYLLEKNTLSNAEKQKFQAICDNIDGARIDLRYALKHLTDYIYKHTSIKPIVLIDEYDTPIHSSYSHGFYDKIIEFTRSMLGSALKDNTSLEKAIMTGITKVSQESMFSGLNNLQSYTLLDDAYAQYFGFTQSEVESLALDGESIQAIRSWYNGYTIGAYQIYNPWSIMNYFKQKKFMTYWVGTSDNALVYELIDNAKPAFKDRIEGLIAGEIQDQIVQTNLIFPELKTNEDALWTLLIHGGYLNVVSNYIDQSGNIRAKIAIPNKEIMQVYKKIVEKWFIIESQSSNFYDVFLTNLKTGNVGEFARHIREYICQSGSYFDFDKNTSERIFHVFMLGILVGLRDDYTITSNRETGLGRADMVLIPKSLDKQGIILEFKACKDASNLQETSALALAQIVENKYTSAFLGSDVKSVLCIGMAFCGKEMAHQWVVL